MRTRLDQQKRQHRERAQPAARQRLGILEKHKDYVKRAKDYHSKEDRIKKLREKAAGRNKDEFYFGMVNSRTEKGVHIQDRGNDPMPVDIVKLLKTQDVGYVRTLLSTEEKIIDRLRRDLGSNVGLLEDEQAGSGGAAFDSEDEDDLGEGTSSSTVSKAAILSLLNSVSSMTGSSSGSSNSSIRSASETGKGKKTVFVDSEKQLAKFNPKRLLARSTPTSTSAPSKLSLDDDAASINKSKGKGKGKAEAPAVSPEAAAAAMQERQAHLASLAGELEARLERLALLQRTYREMQVQRLIMGTGSKKATASSAAAGIVGRRKGDLSAEDERLNEADLDELEIKRIKSGALGRRKLPEPEKGVRTGARVWKWKSERKR